MKLRCLLLTALLSIIATTGCASVNPVTVATASVDIVRQESGKIIWGLYEIEIDETSATASVEPARSAEGHLNATKYLEQSPCANCLKIANIQNLGPKHWLVDIQVSHPWPGLDRYTGFDVRGIVMFDGTYTFPDSGYSYPALSPSSSGALLNPDGYTALFNPTDYPPGSQIWPAWEYQVGKMATPQHPSATLNPFINFETETERRYFGSAASDTRSFDIRFPQDGPLRFGYAVDCSWAAPLVDPPSVPVDFPLEANRSEPYEIGFVVNNNSLWAEPGIGGGGAIDFTLKIYDHQDSHAVSAGGTIEEVRWEIPGMTVYTELTPSNCIDGSDSIGAYTAYNFFQAPVPDVAGPHRILFEIIDSAIGLLGTNERAFAVEQISVSSGESCWSEGELLSEDQNGWLQSHLNNSRPSFMDSSGVLHMFYADYLWRGHHIKYQDGLISNDIIFPGQNVWNISVVPDGEDGIHTLFTDDPVNFGGNVIYRYIDPSDVPGPTVILNDLPYKNQFQCDLALASDGTMLAVWMDSKVQPNRKLMGAWFDGSEWTPQIEFKTCYTPTTWISPTVEADSESVFHVVYDTGDPPDIHYFNFDHGYTSLDQTLVEGDWWSADPNMSIDSTDRLYVTFEDTRYGSLRGFLIMRDPDTGLWTEEKDLVGYNHYNNRYQNQPLPDGRLALVWTDYRDGTRGLYSKVLDPFLTEAEIQALPDDEVDAPFTADKNQTRLCMDPFGTLHLIWTDYRIQNQSLLYYSHCTP